MLLIEGNRYCSDSMTKWRAFRQRIVVTLVFLSIIGWIFTR